VTPLHLSLCFLNLEHRRRSLLRFKQLHCIRFKQLHCLRFKQLHCIRFKQLHCIRFNQLHCFTFSSWHACGSLDETKPTLTLCIVSSLNSTGLRASYRFADALGLYRQDFHTTVPLLVTSSRLIALPLCCWCSCAVGARRAVGASCESFIARKHQRDLR
jgi:hypothetical protein